MKIEEAKQLAAEITIDSLTGAREFKGLGSLGNYIVLIVAQGAFDDAFGPNATIHPRSFVDEFEPMKTKAVQDFVLGILGMGDFDDQRGGKTSYRAPAEAAGVLVQTVYDSYRGWATA